MKREGNKIILEKVGYVLRGIAKIKAWGGGIGFIEMDPVIIDNVDGVDDDTVADNINDAGFGCQEIMGACVVVYELFEKDVEIYDRSVYVGDVTEDDMAEFDIQMDALCAS